MDSAVAQVYQQDIGTRGKLGRMSFYKKGGKGTSPLGKKYMTNAEINARHGECKDYKLNRFMPFSEFRTMPPDIQVLWINAIQDKYDVGLYPISKIIFKFPNDDSLKDHLQRNKIFKDVHPERKRGKTGLQQLRDDVENFRRGLGDGPQLVASIPEPVEPDIPKFMSYEEFKDLPASSQVIFVNRLLEEYSIGMNALDDILFKLGTSGVLRQHLKKLGVLDQIHAPGRGGSIRKFKEGRERLKADIKAWEINNIASYTCNYGSIVDRLKNAMVGDKPVQFQVYDAITESWYTTKDEVEENMKPIPKFNDEHSDILEGPIDLQVIEPSNKVQIGTKFEFVREYTGRKIDVDQLVKLNDMIHYLEEGKELYISIEVRTVDNS